MSAIIAGVLRYTSIEDIGDEDAVVYFDRDVAPQMEHIQGFEIYLGTMNGSTVRFYANLLGTYSMSGDAWVAAYYPEKKAWRTYYAVDGDLWEQMRDYDRL